MQAPRSSGSPPRSESATGTTKPESTTRSSSTCSCCCRCSTRSTRVS
jgi:hypothetical protein